MLGRLRAYTWPPEQTLTYYKETDTSFAARYARAIATYRLGKMVEAIEMLEQLTRVEDERGDPYVYDTMAQIYYESGYPKNAAAFYQKALTTLPESALIQTDLARALIVINEPAYLPEAIKQLESAVRIDDGNADTWRLLATAYGKQNNNPMAYVALAQEAALKGETRNAIAYADYALQGLPEISAGTQLARDIKTSAERHLERKKEGRAY